MLLLKDQQSQKRHQYDTFIIQKLFREYWQVNRTAKTLRTMTVTSILNKLFQRLRLSG